MSPISMYIVTILGMIEVYFGLYLNKEDPDAGRWFLLAGGFILGIVFGLLTKTL